MIDVPEFVIIREEYSDLNQARMIVVKVDEELYDEIKLGMYELISDKSQYPIYMKKEI